MELAEFLRTILSIAHVKYRTFCENVKDGSLLFESCENLMYISSSQLTIEKAKLLRKKEKRNWENNFQLIMMNAGLSEELIEQRMRQLNLLYKLSHINEIVHVLIEIKNLNEMQSDFSFLELIKESVRVLLLFY